MAITPIPPAGIPGIGLAAQVPSAIGSIKTPPTSGIPGIDLAAQVPSAIGSITTPPATLGAAVRPANASSALPDSSDFPGLLKHLLGQLNSLAQQADATATQAAVGQDVDLHQLMMSMESATLGFDLAVEVRNRLVTAYQEITKMAV